MDFPMETIIAMRERDMDDNVKRSRRGYYIGKNPKIEVIICNRCNRLTANLGMVCTFCLNNDNALRIYVGNVKTRKEQRDEKRRR